MQVIILNIDKEIHDLKSLASQETQSFHMMQNVLSKNPGSRNITIQKQSSSSQEPLFKTALPRFQGELGLFVLILHSFIIEKGK